MRVYRHKFAMNNGVFMRYMRESELCAMGKLYIRFGFQETRHKAEFDDVLNKNLSLCELNKQKYEVSRCFT